MEIRDPSTPLGQAVKDKFDSSYNELSVITESGSEVLVGKQADGNLIRLYRPLVSVDSELGGDIFFVEVMHPVYAGDEEVEPLWRIYETSDGFNREVVGELDGGRFRVLHPGEASDLVDIVQKSTFGGDFS